MCLAGCRGCVWQPSVVHHAWLLPQTVASLQEELRTTRQGLQAAEEHRVRELREGTAAGGGWTTMVVG